MKHQTEANGAVGAQISALRLFELSRLYMYGRIVCMKKTLHIDEKLLSEANRASGAATDTDTVCLGLEALVRRAAYERLRTLRGSEPKAKNIPRCREPAARKSCAA